MYNSKKINKEIGLRLKQLRIKAGYKTSESFTTAHKLARMPYWKIEKGLSNITIKTLLRLLNIHKMPIKKFFTASV